MPEAMSRIDTNDEPPPCFFPGDRITAGAGMGSIGIVPPPGRTPIW
jgi:hypothetical protein